MVSHRRARSPRGGVVCTLTTGAAAVGAAAGWTGAPARAASVASVTAEVHALRAQADEATQQYDEATQTLATLQQRVDSIQAQASTIQRQVNKYYGSLGRLAEAQYRGTGVDPTLQLLLSQQPDQYLQRAVTLNAFGRAENVALKSVLAQQEQLAQFHAQATTDLAQQTLYRRQAAAERGKLTSEYQDAQGLLGQLPAAQRRALDDSGVTPQQIAAVPRTSGRIAAAIDFAESKLGLWYEWGGTGNPSYDCSGLVQAAWRAAGIALPRVTWNQIAVGTPVPAQLPALRPGDLIFYLNGAHVAMYVGNGLVIHAPTTGQQIQYGEWDMMPVAAVRRVLPSFG